ncbi:MAG: M14 family zinc carboxypeptidase, partial [Acidobacteriota bacterium]
MAYLTCRIFIVFVILGTMTVLNLPGQTLDPTVENFMFDRYHKPDELNAAIDSLHRSNPDLTTLHRIGQSAGKRELQVLEIRSGSGNGSNRTPAIFVIGNLEGTVPIASEAAIFLAHQLAENADAREDLTWYILATGNPDGTARFFMQPLVADSRNQHAHNDDMDDAVDEDGPDDLDGNGMITQMRAK